MSKLARYVPMPTHSWDTDSWASRMAFRPSETVFCADRTPLATGLFDQHGVPLVRMPDAIPIGFDLTVRRQ